MKTWQGVLVLIWVEAIAISLTWIFVMTFRDPNRNKVTRFVDHQYRLASKNPWVGLGLIRSVRTMLVIQILIAAGLGVFFLIALFIGGWK